ncbi:MAG: hypothetical protein JWP72_2380 [Massilia sp.]|nr:hypothetical protein [Massilia sp.]MDB5792564.1 hypothetical protein [Massilia sp.]
MSTSTDKQDAQGRSWDQVTKNGSSSAGSMGAGGTGDSGKLDQQGQGRQAATRTDDLLTDGCDQDAAGDAFHSAGGRVETGLEGIGSMTGGGAGNRQSTGQSGGLNQQGKASGMRTTETDRDAGNSAREDQQDR